MTEPRLCSRCSAPIPVESPAGLCPACLLQAGFESQSQAAVHPTVPPTLITPQPGTRFVPPGVEEMARLFPQLEILELLGSGGMGAVYKARQPGLDRLVALKILPAEISHDPTFADRFQREARALARLSHPHIVAVYDFGQTSAVPPEGETTSGGASRLYYFVMEYVDGANLRQTIRGGKLSPQEALAIVPQICDALQFAHEGGVVHRDIKPENILIDKKGRVKIADFGLAKLLGDTEQDQSLTATHQVMGTLRYMAPEQMQGSREVDHRADIYSLGVVFYELLTGELPMGRFAPPSKKVQIDVRLDEVVLRALEQDPEQRYQSASDVKLDMESISRSHRSVSATQVTESPTTALVADDPIVFRRLKIVNGILISFWILLFGGLQWGYAASAEWYFKKEMPYDMLMTWWSIATIGISMSLAWWWYLLAKRPDAPHSLTDFFAVLQTPDPRMKRIWAPMLAYFATWMVANLAMLPFGETEKTVCMTIGISLGPIVLMSVLAHAYADRHARLSSDASVDPLSRTDCEQRLSRLALWGAILGCLGLICIPVLMVTKSSPAEVPFSKVFEISTVSETPVKAPLGWPWFKVVATGLIAAVAPFGTTILGGVAMAQIRRSNGTVYGLPLAVADALIFPLLLLDLLIIAIMSVVVMGKILITSNVFSFTSDWSLSIGPAETATLILSVPLIAWFDYLIVTKVWRLATDTRPSGLGIQMRREGSSRYASR